MQNAASEMTPLADTTPSCPQDIQGQLVAILAGLVLGQQLEATP
jgi:hypothetical protein